MPIFRTNGQVHYLIIKYVNNLNRIKEEISTFVNEQTQAWIKISNDSHESMQRLQAARDLVHSLGLETNIQNSS